MELTICQADPLALDFGAHIVEVRDEGGARWALLEATPFHPTSGGQPHDTGWLGEARVVDVVERGGAVWHRVEGEAAPGAARARVDADRRWDHMQQHSGQHLLTAVVLLRHGLRTLAFHLGPDRSDIELDGTPSHEVLGAVEDEVARLIREGRPVTQRVVRRDRLHEVEGLRVRDLDAVPGDAVRLVSIEGLDVNPCCGTHVRDLAWLGTVALLGTERTREGCRVFFAFGDRVRRRLRVSLERELALATRLGRSAEQVAGEVEGLLERLDGARKESAAWKEAWLDQVAAGAGSDDPALVVAGLATPKELPGLAERLRRDRAGRTVLLLSGSPPASFLLAGPGVAVASQVAACLDGRGGGRGDVVQGRVGTAPDVEGAVAALRAFVAAGAGPGH